MGRWGLAWIFLVCSHSLFAGERITLSFREIDLRDALRLIAKRAGVNLVLAGSVRGMVTVELNDVEPIEAMTTLALANGYSLRANGNIFICGAPGGSVDSGEIRVIKLKSARESEVKKAIKDLKLEP